MVGRTNKRHISLALVFVMLCVQLALAQHATVHFIENNYLGHLEAAYRPATAQDTPAGQPTQKPDQKKDKICQICLFAKGFSHASPFAGIDIPVPTPAVLFVLPLLQKVHAKHTTHLFQARAPPPLSSRT